MTTATETFKKAASANARYAADAAEEAAENVSEFANDVTRKAGKQFSRAANMATGAYEEAHEASKEYPHVDSRARSRSRLFARRNRHPEVDCSPSRHLVSTEEGTRCGLATVSQRTPACSEP